jgi:hypothetical protein
MEIPILIKGGTEAERAVADLGTREPNFTTDGKRLYIGAQGVGWNKAETTIAPTALDGNTAVVVTSGFATHYGRITVGAGAGAYTRKLLLPATESGAVAVIDGTVAMLLIEFPASVNPTIEVRNEIAGGTLLWSFNPPEASVRKFAARFVRIAGAWVFFGATELF